MVVLAAQALFERNPASHAIRFIGLLLLVLVAVMVAVEIFDWLRERAANYRANLGAPEEKPNEFPVHEPDTELRHRYHQEIPTVSSREQRANEPKNHLRRRRLK